LNFCLIAISGRILHRRFDFGAHGMMIVIAVLEEFSPFTKPQPNPSESGRFSDAVFEKY